MLCIRPCAYVTTFYSHLSPSAGNSYIASELLCTAVDSDVRARCIGVAVISGSADWRIWSVIGCAPHVTDPRIT